MSKYGAVKYNGYDSKKEAKRAAELAFLERVGVISNLRQQVEFELIPSMYEDDIILKNGKTKRGKIIERAVKYRADFVYIQDGVEVVEDVKGMRTKEYIIKRKLMLYRFGIRVKET